jgi:DNA-binding CsgD family transcriptional regulator
MRARGVIEAIRRRPDEALAALDASLDSLDGLGMPMEEAMTRFERGRILRRTGQRRSAVRELGTARVLFAGLEAQPFVRRCDEELSGDPQAEDAAAGLPLTGRQLRVAEAAAAGKSNRDIAADLFISVKTVEFHVAQVLARLGLDSRTQIAAALRARRHAAGR